MGIPQGVILYENSYQEVMFLNENMHWNYQQNSYRRNTQYRSYLSTSTSMKRQDSYLSTQGDGTCMRTELH